MTKPNGPQPGALPGLLGPMPTGPAILMAPAAPDRSAEEIKEFSDRLRCGLSEAPYVILPDSKNGQLAYDIRQTHSILFSPSEKMIRVVLREGVAWNMPAEQHDFEVLRACWLKHIQPAPSGEATR